jgi:class 3 adenylate cyclase
MTLDGIMAGEIEILDEDGGGIGVHIAARVLGEASDDQVVVTRTVRELATGTDLVYDPLGAIHLRGVPGDGSCSRRPPRESPTIAQEVTASARRRGTRALNGQRRAW